MTKKSFNQDFHHNNQNDPFRIKKRYKIKRKKELRSENHDFVTENFFLFRNLNFIHSAKNNLKINSRKRM